MYRTFNLTMVLVTVNIWLIVEWRWCKGTLVASFVNSLILEPRGPQYDLGLFGRLFCTEWSLFPFRKIPRGLDSP